MKGEGSPKVQAQVQVKPNIPQLAEIREKAKTRDSHLCFSLIEVKKLLEGPP